jgi:hypothetical protein
MIGEADVHVHCVLRTSGYDEGRERRGSLAGARAVEHVDVRRAGAVDAEAAVRERLGDDRARRGPELVLLRVPARASASPPMLTHGPHTPAGVLDRGRARRLHAHARSGPEQRGDEKEERGARPRARRGAREARVRRERARLVRDLGEVCAPLLLRGGELAHGRGVLQERGGGGRGRRGGARAQLDGGLGHGGDGDEQEEQARAAGSGGPDPARRRDA